MYLLEVILIHLYEHRYTYLACVYLPANVTAGPITLNPPCSSSLQMTIFRGRLARPNEQLSISSAALYRGQYIHVGPNPILIVLALSLSRGEVYETIP